jgi:biotin transport system substrate-specific component
MSMQSQGQARAALADALLPEGVERILSSILLVVAGALLLAISAKIKVPFFPVPMTLQTLAVPLIAAAYGARLGVLTVLAYLAAGALGMPVFTNTPPQMASLAYFLGPTGGYLVGYIAAAWIVGAAADRGWSKSFPKLFAAMLAGGVIIFVLGFAWFAFFAALSPGLLELLKLPEGTMGAGAGFAWTAGVAPFLLGDLLKIILAAAAVPAAWRLAERWL